MFKSKWLTDEPAELFICHGGGDGGSSGGGTAGSYSDAVTASETNPGLGLGYPSTDATGVYGGGEGNIGGGGLGGDISAFTAYAYAPDFSVTNPSTFANFGPDATNFSTQGFGLTGAQQGFAGGREGGSLANPSDFGFPGFTHGPGFDTGVWGESPGTVTGGGGGGGSGGGLAGGGGGFSGGQQGGPQSSPSDFSNPADFGDPDAFVGGNPGVGSSMPGLGNQLAAHGWEGFEPHGPVPGMSNLNSWRGPEGQIHPLVDFIRAGWANQRLYTPEYLVDTFTDVGTSPQEAYEQLAARGHVPTPSYAGIQDLNQLGGTGPMFPSPFGDGTQRFPGVNPITLGPDGQLSDLGGWLPPLTPRQAALLGIK